METGCIRWAGFQEMEISNTILPGKSQLPPSRAAGTLTRPALRRRKREHIPEVGKRGIQDKIAEVWKSYGPNRNAKCWAPVLWGLCVVPMLQGPSLCPGLCVGAVGCSLFFFFLINLFIYFCLCWVFVSVRGLPLVAASGGHSSSRCTGLSLSRPLLLWSTGSRRAGSVVVAHGLSCSAACGIFPNQGSNPCPLHWQVDSQPLRHQGSPVVVLQLHLLSRCRVLN